jgi:tetratricopeptide (TPR) repeat protein
MRFWVIFLAISGAVWAVDEPEDKPGLDANPLISPLVEKLPSPAVIPVPGGITMAISSVSAEAQEHVIQGMNQLLGGWDFEAYRQFCAALEVDPDCLMAHWGVAMALLNPEPQFRPQSRAALDRLTELIEKQVGTDLERGYCYALIMYLQHGSKAAADAFRKVSEKYPQDPLLPAFRALFMRSGYDEEGQMNPDQETAEKILKSLAESRPSQPLFLASYLSIHAESPDLASELESARTLVKLAPDYPPFQHLLGVYEWKTGNLARASDAFRNSSDGYSQWMKENKIKPTLCAGWTKAEIFRAVTLAQKGDYNTALALAQSLVAIDVPEELATSQGGQMLLWEGRTLPVRLLLRRNQKGDVAAALKALPPKDSATIYAKKSLCTWYYLSLAFVLETRQAIEKGDLKQAQQLRAAMSLHGEKMAKTKDGAIASGEISMWMRASDAFQVYVAETAGDLALASKDSKGPAYNWYMSARDHRKAPSMLMPPAVLTPMEIRIADFKVADGHPDEALEVLKEAYPRNQFDVKFLDSLANAYRLNQQPDEEAKVRAKITELMEQ